MDTLTVQKAFVRAGFTPDIAEDVTRAIKDNQDVTKADSLEVKEVKEELNKKITEVKLKLKEHIHVLKSDNKLLKWMIGAVIALKQTPGRKN